eukprot:COSAG02_NODE_49982_length_323_cov_0.928571_2_plen_53_part_01
MGCATSKVEVKQSTEPDVVGAATPVAMEVLRAVGDPTKKELETKLELKHDISF